MRKRLLFGFLALLFLGLAVAAYRPFLKWFHSRITCYFPPREPAVRERLDAWQDLKFGVLVHWGVYTVPGICESWNLSDEDWIVRPEGYTYEEYKKWYWGLSESFNPVLFDPSQWADVFGDAGMKYLIFTTKHHDGFCLFDSKATDYTVARGPFSKDPRKDVAKEVFDAFRARGFMVGADFSKPDWHCEDYWIPDRPTPNRRENYLSETHPFRWRRYVRFTQTQLTELTGGRYGPLDILWLDGGWVRGDEIGLGRLVRKARKINPGLIVVDRECRNRNENYQTPEQKIPETKLDIPWESCLSLGNDWGSTPDPHYKTARWVIRNLVEITAKGGNFVLGLGPSAEGLIEDRAIVILRKIGDWTRRCGEAIYGTRTTDPYNDGKIWFTRAKEGNVRFALYALPDGDSLPKTLEWGGLLPDGDVTLLNTGEMLPVVLRDGRALITLPEGLTEESLAFRFQIR